MNANKLLQDHPETYNSIFQAGIIAEKKRVSAWMENVEFSIPKAKEGIKSGKFPDPIDQELEKFNAEVDRLL